MSQVKKFVLNHLKPIVFILSIVVTVLLGILTGIILVYQKGFPQIKRLEDLKPAVITTIYDADNNPIKEYALEKRQIVNNSDIPEYLKNALITAEDKQFKSHWGINFKGTLRAIYGDLILNRNLGGGSSITQQLARELFLRGKKRDISYKRKFQEMLLAIQLEKKYSKEQILSFYLNMIPLGHNIYGVEPASKFYFGKSVKDISVAEAALLVAIPPSPNRIFDIFNSPLNCVRRRNEILKEMLQARYINKKQYEEALKEELPKESHGYTKESLGDYFFEEIRRKVKTKYGDERLYKEGLKIYTTLDLKTQKWAEDALKEGLRELDKRQDWRKGEYQNLLKPKKDLDLKTHNLKSWEKLKIEENKIAEGIVLSSNYSKARVKIKDYQGILNKNETKWTKKNSIKTLLKKGDIGLFKILKINEKKKNLTLSLEREPKVEGAIIVLDNKTGEVKAMSGGYSFARSEFNRAVQAPRQPGSIFKPIIYSTAMENGYTAATIIEDAPYEYYDATIDETWILRNDQRNYKGPLTLRRAFEGSRNTVSARIVELLTPQKVIETARRFGITSTLRATHSIAVGTYEVRLMEITAAYTTFPNLGVRVRPYFIRTIRDRNNNIIEENHPNQKRVLDKETAYIINNIMQGVIESGTAWRAKHLREFAPIGGKTGTMDLYTDAWFVGFSPSITVGVWVGFDLKKYSLGEKESGARAALPIFSKFMENYLKEYPETVQEYEKPEGIILKWIDKYTGKLLNDSCLYRLQEAFKAGTEPVTRCNDEEHLKITDYFDNISKKNDEENNGEIDN